ncbi:MAG: DUF1232 domain-containing protein [Anaerolineae bacterium]|nr:DUF1232 domain-containing protein [Chloroflexota bacterium]
MSEDRRPVQVTQEEDGAVLAWLKEMVRQFRLAWRLFWDRRVPLWTKIVPPAALAYVLSPIDILSDLPPMGINQLDDIAVVLLGVRLFIELAPPDVVREHLRALGARVEEWRVVDEGEAAVVEGGYETEESGTDDSV